MTTPQVTPLASRIPADDPWINVIGHDNGPPVAGFRMQRMYRPLAAVGLLVAAGAAGAAQWQGRVFDDRDGDGIAAAGEPGIAGVVVSDGRALAVTDGEGRYRLDAREGEPVFVVKPAGWRLPMRADGLPAAWHAPVAGEAAPRADFALRRAPEATGEVVSVLLFADPQVKTLADVDYYARDIVDPLAAAGGPPADLGISLGDIVDDVAGLYPDIDAVTTRLGVPWLHVPGNHDLDPGAASDAGSLSAFRARYGPDTFAWEEGAASIVVLDDVVLQPGQRPAYVGGLREDQFAFLEAWLPTVPEDRLLVLAVHIPLFDTAAPGRPETFRRADRERLFALLADVPKLLVLSGHRHTQRHYRHGPAEGWHAAEPLHEYNVGAASGAFWSGAPDAAGNFTAIDVNLLPWQFALDLRMLVAILYLVAAIMMFIGLGLVYNLDKKTLNRMNEELAARRVAAAE